MIPIQQVIADEPTLTRYELIGNLARAARLALQESETADSVEIVLVARPEGFTVDVTATAAGELVHGWGM